MTQSFDIIITGGGIAGCIAAMHLHPFYSVLIIEKKGNLKILHGETLVATSKRVFNELGIDLAHIINLSDIAKPVIGMQSYWGTAQPIFQDSLRNPEGNGWSINKIKFVENLQKLTQGRKISFVREEIHHIKETDHRWIINTRDIEGLEKTYYANFIIDASGRRSIMAQKMDLKRVKKDQLIGIHASIHLPSYAETSTIFPVKDGWWYISKLPNGNHLLSYFTDADLCDKRLTNNAKLFEDNFQNQKDLINILEVNTADLNFEFLGTKAAHSSIIAPTFSSNWIAIGDAYMTFDPLSSQGMYNAMVMAAQIAKRIIQSDVVHTLSNQVKESFHLECHRMANEIWSHFEYHHYIYYSMERRWADHPFWKRRQKI